MVELTILYSNEHLCVIDKPPGSVVHKTRGAKNSIVLLQLLRDQIGQRVYPLHRLDNATSGCLAFALSSESAADYQRALQDPQSKKIYQALVFGRTKESGIIDRNLSNENGVAQTAITEFRLMESLGDYSLLELRLKTGRRNQIRRHLSHLGHHIVGDVNFGKGWLNRRFRENYNFHRLFLHCTGLQFTDPYTLELSTIDSPMDEQLMNLIFQLRKK